MFSNEIFHILTTFKLNLAVTRVLKFQGGTPEKITCSWHIVIKLSVHSYVNFITSFWVMLFHLVLDLHKFGAIFIFMGYIFTLIFLLQWVSNYTFWAIDSSPTVFWSFLLQMTHSIILTGSKYDLNNANTLKNIDPTHTAHPSDVFQISTSQFCSPGTKSSNKAVEFLVLLPCKCSNVFPLYEPS